MTCFINIRLCVTPFGIRNEGVNVQLMAVSKWADKHWHFNRLPAYAEKGRGKGILKGAATNAAKWIEWCPRKWLKSSQEYTI